MDAAPKPMPGYLCLDLNNRRRATFFCSVNMDWLLWVGVAVSAVLGIVALKVADVFLWKPLRLKKYFEAQGVRGPPYKLVYGNLPDIIKMASEESRKPLPLLDHNILPRVYPAYHRWTKAYGGNFLFWFGTKPRLYIPDAELVKEVLSNKFGHYEKVPLTKMFPGLVWLDGEKWVYHRRVLNPAFHKELIKGMVPSFVESTKNVLEEWSKLVSSGLNEFNVQKGFSVLSSDALARAAFGSSYAEGKRIFELQAQLSAVLFEAARGIRIPGSRFLPTRKNRQMNLLEKEIKKCMMEVIEDRERTVGNDGDYGTDVLGILMSSNKKQGKEKLNNNLIMSIDDMISECQNFYAAGHDTTATLLTWTTILLAMHQDWQEKARKEVLEVCGKKDFPTPNTVNDLKTVEMILNESLRLYPPALAVSRQTCKPMTLGGIAIPTGTHVFIPILAIHHDPALWGNDAHEFNPERFRGGIARAAKHPMAFMPFIIGPRICIGHNFALVQTRVGLAMLLQRFSFTLSPQYVHAPLHTLALKPQYGAQIIFQHLN